jgi:hypothetical protein
LAWKTFCLSTPTLSHPSRGDTRWSTWNAPCVPSHNTGRDQWEPQQQQINEADQNGIARILTIELSLDPQATHIGQELQVAAF